MLSKKFHEKWALPVLILICCFSQAAGQCPATKSASFAMVDNGLPSRDLLQPIDFYVNPADTARYYDVQLSEDNFKCIDLGIRKINLSGRDAQGNLFSCNEFLWVYDSVFLCKDEISVASAVGGKVFTETNQAIEQVTMTLSGTDINYFRGTDTEGLFLFENIVPTTYRIFPSAPSYGVRNGISTFDVLLLQKHILGLKNLDSPYKILAADINSSNSLTAFDMVLLRQMILSVIGAFPNTNSWKFIPADYTFSDPSNPFADAYPEEIILNEGNALPQLDNRFIGIKMGDLNNTVNLQAAGRSRAGQNSVLDYSNNVLALVSQEAEYARVSFSLDREQVVEGFQFALSFDEEQIEFIAIEGLPGITDDHYFKEKGLIKLSWTTAFGAEILSDRPFLNLIFKKKNSDSRFSSLRQADHILPAEIYLKNEEIQAFKFLFEKEAEDHQLQLLAPFPNPFSKVTNIPFYLPESGIAEINLFHLNGQLISKSSRYFGKGENTFRIQPVLPASGIYMYEVRSKGQSFRGKVSYISK